jgi:DNA polymerase-1
MEQPRLLVIDGHSMAFRAFYALPVDAMQTTTGLATNAVYGFTSMLLRLLTTEEPTHVVIAFDLPGGTFRTEQLPSYKGTRSPTPPEFEPQIGMVEQVLAALRIHAVSKPNYEADDVIATLTTQATREGWQVLVASGDRDTLQLVTDDVTVLYPVRGVSQVVRMTPEEVTTRVWGATGQLPGFGRACGRDQ